MVIVLMQICVTKSKLDMVAWEQHKLFGKNYLASRKIISKENIIATKSSSKLSTFVELVHKLGCLPDRTTHAPYLHKFMNKEQRNKWYSNNPKLHISATNNRIQWYPEESVLKSTTHTCANKETPQQCPKS